MNKKLNRKLAEITDGFDAMRGSIENALTHLYETAYVLDQLGQFDSMADTMLSLSLRASFSVKSVVNGVEELERMHADFTFHDKFSTYFGYDKSVCLPKHAQKLSLKLGKASSQKLMKNEFSFVENSATWTFDAVIENADRKQGCVFFLREISFTNKKDTEMAQLLQSMTVAHFTHFAIGYGEGEEYTLPLAKAFMDANPQHNHWDVKTIDTWNKDPSEMQDLIS